MGSGKRSAQPVSYQKVIPTTSTSSTKPYPPIDTAKKPTSPISSPEAVDIHHVPLLIYISTAFCYSLLIILGQIRDTFGRWRNPDQYKLYSHHDGYAPLVDGFERMFHRYIYTRIRDVFSRPITGVPGRTIRVLERASDDFNQTYNYSGKSREVLNLSSYNYLGFSQSEGFCTDRVIESTKTHGVTTNSSTNEVGYSQMLRETERLVAKFVGKPDAIIMSQGFSTNSTTLPALVGKGCLILSDELNHTSLVNGARLSGSVIRSIKHNSIEHLEKVLRDSIASGQPRTHKPWLKILVVVEGLYSMEGTLPHLEKLIELKKKYKFYIYLDEAHSIGALGSRGRGTCDHLGVDPHDIDIMMGTFTKSFGAAGGYIAASQDIINRLRVNNHNSIYGEAMSVPVVRQVYTSMAVILGESGLTLGAHTDEEEEAALLDGRRRLHQLAFNSNYFHSELKSLGFTLIGDASSPVVPMMVFHSSKIAAFSRECLEAGIAVVVVGYPATPLMRDRVRFCISAAHTKADLDFAIRTIDRIGDRLLLKNLA